MLGHAAEASEIEDIEARVSELERAAEVIILKPIDTRVGKREQQLGMETKPTQEALRFWDELEGFRRRRAAHTNEDEAQRG